MARLRIIEQTNSAIHLEVETLGGTVEIIADFAWFPDEKKLVFDRAHIQGPGKGTLGLSGLNEVKSALAEFGGQHGAKAVIIQGARRTSGRLAGKVPTTVFLPCF